MTWLTGNWPHLATVAGKAVLMYVAALLMLRVGERRTLAQWTAVDFVAAAAIGAVVGRTAVASSQSFLTGAVALAVLIAAHRLVSLARFQPLLARLVDHRVRVLVAHGRLCRDQLRLCGLTADDVYAQLRRRGVFDLAAIQYLLYESRGELTVVCEPDRPGDLPGLVRIALAAAHTPGEARRQEARPGEE